MKHAPALPRPCPCGQTHMISGGAAGRIAARGDTLPVLTRYGAWYVPYAFAVVHGVHSDTVAAAARQYGFAAIGT